MNPAPIDNCPFYQDIQIDILFDFHHIMIDAGIEVEFSLDTRFVFNKVGIGECDRFGRGIDLSGSD